MDYEKLNHLMNRTKIALMSNREAVFFTSIILSMKIFWDTNHRTAWTNAYSIGFNPEFYLSLTEDERVFVLVHEAMHVALDHLGRILGRDMARWNAACDYFINLYLVARGFKMPKVGLYDKRFEGMSADEIYDALGKEPLLPNPFEDMVLDEHVMDKGFKKHVEDLIIRAVMQAEMTNQGGCIPGDVALFIKNLVKPKLPWQQILRREVDAAVKTGYSWMKPNRRYFPQHHLPSTWSIGPTQATFYVDISCSVTDRQFHTFVSEIVGSMKMFNFNKITIVQFDTEIKSVDVVSSLAGLMKVKFKGRGGTHIECILEHMERTKPPLAMVFTDGGFDWPRTKFKQRILWLINDNPLWKPLFGRAIHFDTPKEEP